MDLSHTNNHVVGKYISIRHTYLIKMACSKLGPIVFISISLILWISYTICVISQTALTSKRSVILMCLCVNSTKTGYSVKFQQPSPLCEWAALIDSV